MEEGDVCVPPGFRFHPTEEELVGYYLARKVASQRTDLDVIADIDLYRIEPWDLQDRCKLGYEEQTEWYFFSHKDKKYPSGTRTNRATVAGFWKATGRDKAVFSKRKLIGMRKTLVFYKGRAPNGRKTDWIMHEYRLETSEHGGAPQDEGWVVCRAFQKRNPNQRLNIEPWVPIHYLRDQNHATHTTLLDFVNPRELMESSEGVSFHEQVLACKHEVGTEQTHMGRYIQLPQLSSPSLATSLASTDCFEVDPMLNQERDQKNSHGGKLVDWRELDKLLASQLSEATTYPMTSNNFQVFPLDNEEHARNQLDGFLFSDS